MHGNGKGSFGQALLRLVKSTHILDPFGCLNLLDGLVFIWVSFNPMLGHKETEKLTARDTEDPLLRVQLRLILRRFPNVSSRSCTSVALSLVLTTMSSI